MLDTIKQEAASCRAAWAGLPVGTMAHKCHHNIELEPLTEPAENRIAYILTAKPEAERAWRLHDFRPWPLPLPPAFAKAVAKYAKARAEYAKARAEYDKARAEYDKARAEYDKARAKYDKARAEYYTTPEFLETHKKLFPDCHTAPRSDGI